MENIDWKALTPEQRNMLIAEKVMDQRIHAEFVQGSETELDHALYVDGPDGVTRIEAIPRYSESMDAAWEIVKRAEVWTDPLWRLHETLAQVCGEPSMECVGLWQITPQRICIAALRACGHGVQT